MLKLMKQNSESELPPLFEESVAAGFPSPVHGRIATQLDIHERLVPHPNSTFFVRTSGDSMSGIGILPGDILVVDRSITPKHQDIVIAQYQGEFTVKKLIITPTGYELHPENPRYPILHLQQNQLNQIFGVVTSSFREYTYNNKEN